MKQKLKPCPFCGSRAYEGVTRSFDNNDNIVNSYKFYCKDCKISFMSLSEKEVETKWNTRHDEMTLKKVLLLIPELVIKIFALAVLAAGVYWIFA